MKLGLKRGEVRLVPHQPEWQSRFTKEKRRLTDLLGEMGIQIEHVGSTAVPALPAKPIIDIAIAVRAIEDIVHWPATLEPGGYTYFGDREGRGDHFFAKGPENCRSFYLHVVPRESCRWSDYLRFRDLLRADASLREEYAQLKTGLCEAHSRDRAVYTSAKAALIRRVLKEELNQSLQPTAPSGRG
jgi:GrpB-like predicted nucleotidyltransferase (UPF0157 family)